MKKFLRLAAFAGMMATSAVSQATPFDFSYTFATGDIVTGSFDGSANGNLITILSDLAISLDGVAFNGSGSLFFLGLNGFNVGGPAIVSFNGLQNNFFASDGSVRNPFGTNIFYTGAFNGGATDTAAYLTSTGANGDGDGGYDASRWNISAVSADVPEPATWALMLGGLGLIGVNARRRQAGAASAA